MEEPMSVEQLCRRIEAGEAFKYLYFWGHRPKHSVEVDKSCFSQWFGADFEIDGVTYTSAEHYMMAGKARLFGDEAALARILAARTPAEAKSIGREILGFDEAAWNAERLAIVTRANHAKFGQNPALREFLLGTGDRVLVEASPVDAIWGIGLAVDHPDAGDPARWRGLNLLGVALMSARDALRREGQNA
ncbi:NADAR family protein [Pseudomonas nitroreducens]|uniref:NADAR family protein n=1 Tax=Pseudomonas nitroreducens TaxID=46680 RepID=A0A5R9AHZ0_PSENT|nr:NADAR family protein [Pseudomonas nitroreducens]TLP77804.1 NADAR family protein [Pseudomonas nitroreducens]